MGIDYKVELPQKGKIELHTIAGVKALQPRNAVYWHKLTKGAHVGIRKTGKVGTTEGSWHARHTDSANGNYRTQKSLGADIGFDGASELAREFCKSKTAGVDHTYTVGMAIEAYIDNRSAEKTEESGQGGKQNLGKHIPESLLNQPVADLNKGILRRWRNALLEGANGNKPVVKTTANRIMADFIGALNLCYNDGVVDSKKAWTKLRFKSSKGEGARDVFFTPEQEQTLLSLCDGQFKVLIEAALLIGARPPGELANLRVRDFDAAKGSLKITADSVGAGKTGAREMILSDKGVEFFELHTAGKSGDDWIIPKDSGEKWRPHDQYLPWQMIRRKNKKLDESLRFPHEAVLYSCRHTYISRMVAGGVPMLAIAKNAGTSVQMIEEHYGHFAETDLRAMLNRAEG